MPYFETEKSASEYLNRFRNVVPAVYNHKRLREMPFPSNLERDETEFNSSSSDSDSPLDGTPASPDNVSTTQLLLLIVRAHHQVQVTAPILLQLMIMMV